MRTNTKRSPGAVLGRSGSTGDLTDMEVSAVTQHIHIPVVRTWWLTCGDRSPQSRRCNRPRGHGGRHLFAWRHLDGRVREVWA